MSRIGVGRFADSLRRYFHIGNELETAGELAPEIMAVLTMDPDPVELRALRGERICVGATSMAALAANFNAIMLFNPGGSGVIAIVERILASTDAGQSIQATRLGSNTGFNAVASVEISRDTRFDLTPTVGVFTRQQVAGIGVAVIASTPWDTTEPWVLVPSQGVVIQPNAVNLNVQATFWWRERAMDRLEVIR